mmetsp:Transcript_10084/g.14783  ORF Transcript_10084/g.14783 Transcript_10084/m.14783 type:complete len:108 (+) Transcript_10084:2116-2439(+)
MRYGKRLGDAQHAATPPPTSTVASANMIGRWNRAEIIPPITAATGAVMEKYKVDEVGRKAATNSASAKPKLIPGARKGISTPMDIPTRAPLMHRMNSATTASCIPTV